MNFESCIVHQKETVTRKGGCFFLVGGWIDEDFGSISERPNLWFGKRELMQASEASRSLVSSAIETWTKSSGLFLYLDFSATFGSEKFTNKNHKKEE